MSRGAPLSWAVPKSSWEYHNDRIAERYGSTDGFVGFELARIMVNWMEIEDVDNSVLDLPDPDNPHTQKTNDSETPLSEEAKTNVGCRVDADVKARFSAYAGEYDVNQGVLLGYVIREYYETDAWGCSLESIETDSPTQPDPEPVRNPTSRTEKLRVICDTLDNGTDGDLLYDEIHDAIADVAGPSVVDGANGYFEDVLDELGYVHHPNAENIFIPASELERRFDLTPSDPAIDRKPYSALSKDERVEGIKLFLQRERAGKSMAEIHTELFNGNGSTSYMRNLMDEVAASDGFRYKTTMAGKKLLVYSPSTRSGSSGNTAHAQTDGGVDVTEGKQ